MNRPGAGILTLVHDPEDDPETTQVALAAHDRDLRQITVHPTPGTASATMLALDILTALGARITTDTANRQHLGTPQRAFTAVAAWLVAYEIDVVIVLRTHLLSPAARHHLARLATDAGVRVVALWHGRRPREWAAAFSHPPAMTREIEEIDAVLADPRPHRAEDRPPSRDPPPVGPLLGAGFPGFRAQARRTLDPDGFAALEAD